jgi:hypothetical protein
MSFRPFAHGTDRKTSSIILCKGGRVGFCSQFSALELNSGEPGMDDLLEDIQVLKPTQFGAPPRYKIFEL